MHNLKSMYFLNIILILAKSADLHSICTSLNIVLFLAHSTEPYNVCLDFWQIVQSLIMYALTLVEPRTVGISLYIFNLAK